MAKLKLDLHDIFNKGKDIDRALNDLMDEAVDRVSPWWRSFPAKAAGS